MENNSKREAIINSALEIFERDGFDKAKVEEIAKKANVGKGTIYEYFSSKRDLFYQMVISMIDIYIREIEKLSKKDVNPIQKLESLINFQIESVKKHGNLIQVIHFEVIKSGMEKDLKGVFLEFRGKQIKLIEKIIEEGIELKLFKKENTYMSALFFIGGVNQFVFEQKHMHIYGDNREFNTKEFLDSFLRGVIE